MNFKPPILSAIVAVAENGVIGAENDLPWRLSADLQRFRRLTMGHHIVMGRKTWESIGRLLPGRTSVIVTRQTNYEVQGAKVANAIENAIELCQGDDEPFIVGGAEIYRASLPLVTRLYFTRVHTEIEGDARFPEMNWANWRKIEQTFHSADEKNEFDHTFSIWDRQ